MRVLIVFASKKGSARRLAEQIAIGCQNAGITPDIVDLRDSYKFFDYLHFLPFQAKYDPKETIGHDIANYDLIFTGFEVHNISENSKLLHFIELNDFRNKKVALFCSYYFHRKYLNLIESRFRARNADVFNTISLKRKGLFAFFGRGVLDENDLVRAQAFAERTINNLLGRRITKDSEKSQIRGYRK